MRGKGPSTSVALNVKLIAVPSFTVIGPGTVSTGGSFTGVTVIVTVAGALVRAAAQLGPGVLQLYGALRMVTTYVKVSVPLKLAFGVLLWSWTVPVGAPFVV